MKLRHLFCAALLGTVLSEAHAAADASPAKVPGFTFVKTVGPISEFRLESNGLQVLLLPEHSSPTLTFMVTYRVGSRNEVTGHDWRDPSAGAFDVQGYAQVQPTRKNTSVNQLLERVGGIYNASTSFDRTNYYANIASENLDSYMAIESDRMRNLWLREADRKPEMTVVRNEFEIGENNPAQALEKEIYAAAYVAHPYHHSTIGWRSDIEKVPIEKLQEFYNTFYWPENATATVIGDFEPRAALELIKKHFGAIPKAPKPIPAIYTEEPEQTGPRRVTVQRAGELGVVAVAHKVPEARHADQPALQILDAILTEGKNSRFYRALTDKNLTTGVQGELGSYHDPSLHILFANLAPASTHEQVEKILLEEIERVKKEGVTDGEVAAAAAQILAASAYARDGSFAVASTLNEDIASGDWTLYVTGDEALKKVTAADVQRVAKAYFVENKRTTGWFIPVVSPEAPEEAIRPGPPAP